MAQSNNDYHLSFTEEAELEMEELKSDHSKKPVAKAVIKSLQLMKENLRHPSLKTHKYDELKGPNGEEIYESDYPCNSEHNRVNQNQISLARGS